MWMPRLWPSPTARTPSRRRADGCRHRRVGGKADRARPGFRAKAHGHGAARGRILQVGHLERFNPAVAALARMVRIPLFFEVHRLSVFTPRSLDVDVVLDLMIHDIDIVLSLVGRRRTEIRAAGISILSAQSGHRQRAAGVSHRLHRESHGQPRLHRAGAQTAAVSAPPVHFAGLLAAGDQRTECRRESADPFPAARDREGRTAAAGDRELSGFGGKPRAPARHGRRSVARAGGGDGILAKIEEHTRVVAQTLQACPWRKLSPFRRMTSRPPDDVEPRLLLDWSETREPGAPSAASLPSCCIWSVLVVTLSLPRNSGVRCRRIDWRQLRRVTPLVAPPFELTQKEPNRGKVSKEIDYQSLLPRPHLTVPAHAAFHPRERDPAPPPPPPPVEAAKPSNPAAGAAQGRGGAEPNPGAWASRQRPPRLRRGFRSEEGEAQADVRDARGNVRFPNSQRSGQVGPRQLPWKRRFAPRRGRRRRAGCGGRFRTMDPGVLAKP